MSKQDRDEEPQKITRAPLPKQGEVIGIIEQRHRGNKMKVDCLGGKERNCRVPGRLKRSLWLRPNDVVIVQPWELDNTKGDVLFKYNPSEIDFLKNKGFLKQENNEF